MSQNQWKRAHAGSEEIKQEIDIKGKGAQTIAHKSRYKREECRQAQPNIVSMITTKGEI